MIIFSKEEIFINTILFGKENEINIKLIGQLNLEKIIKISSSQLILPLIYSSIKRANIIQKFPIEFIDYLREIHKINFERNIILKKEIVELSKLLKKNNINHLFIKGSAFVYSDIYLNIGDRMVGDIDILIKNNQSKKAFKLLEKSGYKGKEKIRFFEGKKKHLNRQINKKKLFAVELHTRLFDNKNFKYFNSKIMLSNSIVNNKINTGSLNNQLMHNIYNYQYNDSGYFLLDYTYKNLYDTYLLIKKIKPKNVLINFNMYTTTYFMINNYLQIKEFDNFSNNSKKIIPNLMLIVLRSGKVKNLWFITYKLWIKAKWLPLQIKEILVNKKYRSYLINKLKS